MPDVDRTPREDAKIYAPWSHQVAAALNRYQENGFGHPFTCGSTEHPKAKLVAGMRRWYCLQEGCAYTQNWAWTFMADPELERRLERTLEQLKNLR